MRGRLEGENERMRRLLAEAPRARSSAAPPTDVLAFLDLYLPFPLSPAWRAVWGAAYGLPGVDGGALAAVCGFREGSPGGYGEALVVAGRRSGKSALSAAVGLYEACVRGEDHMRHLAPGQRGYVIAISRTQRQALEVFRYARAIVERNPELAALLAEEPLESQSGGELRFSSGVNMTVMPASKGSVRGYTVLSAILDEFAWVGVDAESADQDEEIAAAVRFGMVAPEGAARRRLVTISSPAAKAGLVYETYRRCYGRADAPVLVAQGPTWAFNPAIAESQLAEERARDPRRYSREVLAEFSDAISAWIDGAVIDASVEGRDEEPLAPSSEENYLAAVDMAFAHDSAVLAVGHWTDDRLVVDAIERLSPQPGHPLDSRLTVARFAQVCRAYDVTAVLADQYAYAPLAADFRDHGIELREEVATNISKLAHYGKLRELFYGRRVSLPRHEVALRELKQLEEKISSSGHIHIAAPNRAGAHDDTCAALAWLVAAATSDPSGADLLRRIYRE